MADTLQAVSDRVQIVQNLLNGIPLGGNTLAVQAIQQELSELGRYIETAQQQQAFSSHAGQEREYLAGCQVQVRKIIQSLDYMMTASAEDYRQAAGEGKNDLEHQPDATQQSANPEAYQHKSNFWQLTACKDEMRQIASGIMETEEQLEHGQLMQSSFTANDSVDAGELGAPSDTSSLSP
ncbi:hypothetical protein [Paenibacillus xanthanilyticus]|uniref:Mediator complex subunit 11 n=1 Tax=Paenibacillus xanthanilyticus TaxID=1783531 RepID=A0ABV8K5J3_9BACL